MNTELKKLRIGLDYEKRALLNAILMVYKLCSVTILNWTAMLQRPVLYFAFR